MLDEHERHGAQVGERFPYQLRADRIEIRRRFVEQQQARAEREHSGDRQALLLTAGERRRRPVLRIREVHLRERAVHPRPDRLGGDAVILETERHVVAGARHHELRLGILEHDARRVTRVVGRASVDPELALGLTAPARVEQAGEGREQRALARARCPEQ